jgi:competence protein ComEA
MKNKATLLLLAVALITAALLAAFKAIDIYTAESLEGHSAVLNHSASQTSPSYTEKAQSISGQTVRTYIERYTQVVSDRAMPEMPDYDGYEPGDYETVYYETGETVQDRALPEEAVQPESSQEKININTASAEELTALSGIGEVKAEAIVAFREENGYFRSIEELALVKGIGEATINANRDRITIDQE